MSFVLRIDTPGHQFRDPQTNYFARFKSQPYDI
jgi:hypothetical protein